MGSQVKKTTKVLKHLFVPHRGNAFRPHALRHQALVFYGVIFIFFELILGLSFSATTVSAADASQVAKEIIAATNQKRTENGVALLSENKDLDIAAQAKLDDMFKNNYWDHYGPNGQTAWQFIDATGYKYELAGENLAKGYATPEETTEAWMASPTHRQNLLDERFTDIGVAVGSGSIENQKTTLTVQLFGKPVPASALSAASETTNPPQVKATAKYAPTFSVSNIIQSQKLPYLFFWSLLLGLVILDGIMIKKLGLSNSKKHVFHFRTALVVVVLGIGFLGLGIAAIA